MGHEHDHEHEHEHGEGENRKATIIKLIISAVLFGVALLLEHVFKVNTFIYLAVYIAAYAAAGVEVVISAVKGIIHGHPFDECLLMTVASVGAFFTGSFAEAAAVMILYSFGEFLQDLAVDKSRDSISELIDVVPKNAEVLRGGQIISVAASEVETGDTVIVKSGASVPVDGVVISGSASFDTSALTGEAYPKDIATGECVLSGYLDLNGEIKIRATASYDNSAASRIKELIEGAEAKKAKTETFITKFSRIYTPAVVLLALLIAVIPPVFVGEWKSWIHRALTFLVVSCPCALVISVPLTFFSGIGAASRKGILIKGAEHLETLSKADIFAFDKTGTLTNGTFTVTDICDTGDKEKLINTACSIEAHSNHPIAKAVSSLRHVKEEAEEISEIPGEGIVCKINGEICAAGNKRLMERYSVKADDAAKTAVHICRNGEYLGYIAVVDKPKENAADAIKQLSQSGVKMTVMLSGDTHSSANAAAAELGMTDVKASLLPEHKVSELEELLKKGKVAYVGDGINDAAVLARADVGLAMGALGSDAAIEAADIVITDDNVIKIPQAKRIAKKTLSIAKQNIIFAIAVKVIVLVLSAIGVNNMMWLAVFADTGVALLCAANAMRAMICR